MGNDTSTAKGMNLPQVVGVGQFFIVIQIKLSKNSFQSQPCLMLLKSQIFSSRTVIKKIFSKDRGNNQPP
jgi:hypothetical protein